MRRPVSFLLFGLLVLGLLSSARAMTIEERSEQVANLHWELDAKDYDLSLSGSQLRLPENVGLVRGADANQFVTLINGAPWPGVEAVMYDGTSQAIWQFFEAGYVSLNDWDSLDASALLKTIIKNTANNNEARKQAGLPEMFVNGWVQEPHLDRSSSTVFWAIEGVDSNHYKVWNVVALKLGRRGFEKLTYVIEGELLAKGTREQHLQSIKSIKELQQFKTGYRYADFSAGDKLAAFGIASLVAATAGGSTTAEKGAVAGIFAVIALALKKLWFLIALPFVGAWRWLRGGKKAKKAEPGARSEPSTRSEPPSLLG